MFKDPRYTVLSVIRGVLAIVLNLDHYAAMAYRAVVDKSRRAASLMAFRVALSIGIAGGATKISMACVAYCRMTTAGAIVAGSGWGGIATARTGAGEYTLTLSDGGVDALNVMVIVQPETADISTQITHTSDTVKGLSTKLASTAVATDSACMIAVLQLVRF